MNRTGLIIIGLVLVLVFLLGSVFWILIGNPLNPLLAEYRIQSTLQSLPSVPGSVVVQSWKGTEGGSEEGCGVLDLQEMIGTSALSFPEVLNYYTASLPTRGWQPGSSDIHGRGFDIGNEMNLDIADVYDFANFSDAAVSEARSKFKTLFFIEMFTPLNVSNFEKCRGG